MSRFQQKIKQIQKTQEMITSLEYDVEQLINNVGQSQIQNTQQLGFCYRSIFSYSSFQKILKQADRQYFPKLNGQLSKIMAIFKGYKEHCINKQQKQQFIFRDEPFISVIEGSKQCLKLVDKYEILIKEKLSSFSKQQKTKIQMFTQHLQQATLSLTNLRCRTQQLQKHQKQNYYRKIENQSQKNLLGDRRICQETFFSGKQIKKQNSNKETLGNQSDIVEQVLKENTFLNEKMKLLQKQNNSLKFEIKNQNNLSNSLKKQIESAKEQKNHLMLKIEDLQHEKYETMKVNQNKLIEPKIKQDQVQKYISELAQKQQIIKSLKAQNQKSSIELNKKIKVERDKCELMKKQNYQKLQELELNLQIANQKIQRISKQLQNFKKSYEKISFQLSQANKQNTQLKQQLEEIFKQNQPTTNNQPNSSIISQSNNDEKIVILHQQLNESNAKIQELEKQLMKNKSSQTLNQELLQKVNQLTIQNKVLQKKIFTYILKINSLENQIDTKEGNKKN